MREAKISQKKKYISLSSTFPYLDFFVDLVILKILQSIAKFKAMKNNSHTGSYQAAKIEESTIRPGLY